MSHKKSSQRHFIAYTSDCLNGEIRRFITEMQREILCLQCLSHICSTGQCNLTSQVKRWKSFFLDQSTDGAVAAWFCRLCSGTVLPAHLSKLVDENWSSVLSRHWAGSEQSGFMFTQSEFSHQLMGIVWEQEFSKKWGWQDLDLYQCLGEGCAPCPLS